MKPCDSIQVWHTILFLTSNYHVEVFIDKDLMVLHSIDKFNEHVIEMSKSSDEIQMELEKLTDSLTLRRNLKLIAE